MGFVIKYKNVFKLSLWHHHWTDTDSAVFAPPPSAATPAALQARLLRYDLRRFLDISLSPRSENQLRSRGLIFKKSGTGCLLASKDGFLETDPKAKVCLLLRSADPKLLGYTDFGFSAFGRKLLYAHNFDAPLGTLRNANGLATTELHEQGGSGRVDWASGLLQLPKTNPAAGGSATIQVFDPHSNPVQQVLERSVQTQPGETHYALDCRSLQEGLYRFDGPNLAPNTLRYVGLDDVGGLLGVLELYLRNLDDTDYHLRINKN
jgi:hypothetical protein